MPYSWLSEALYLTQMVMDVRKALKITIYIIPNNFCFNNIAKNSKLSFDTLTFGLRIKQP